MKKRVEYADPVNVRIPIVHYFIEIALEGVMIKINGCVHKNTGYQTNFW